MKLYMLSHIITMTPAKITTVISLLARPVDADLLVAIHPATKKSLSFVRWEMMRVYRICMGRREDQSTRN